MESRHKSVLEENEQLRLKLLGFNATRQDLEIQRGSAREKALQVETLEAKVEREKIARRDAEDRTARFRKERDELAKEVADLKKAAQAVQRERAEEERRRLREELQTLEMHIPCVANRITDEILVYDTAVDRDTECYAGSEAGLACLHVTLNRDGRRFNAHVKNTRQRVRKRPRSEVEEPAAQRRRHE